jgi:hypothetical protein
LFVVSREISWLSMLLKAKESGRKMEYLAGRGGRTKIRSGLVDEGKRENMSHEEEGRKRRLGRGVHGT